VPKHPKHYPLGQSLDGLKAIILIKIDLKGAANTIVQNKWPQDPGGETNIAAIKALCKNCFCTTLIQALKLLSGNSQTNNNTFQEDPINKTGQPF
jgi:hypothetical protein